MLTCATIMLKYCIFLLSILCFFQVEGDSGSATKGTYKVYGSSGLPCITIQADIYLYLTYLTSQSEKDVVIHVPTSSSVNKDVSSCDKTILASGMSIASQLVRIDLDHMKGWTLDLAFTEDNRFKTDNNKEFVLFQVNVTANFSSDPSMFPDPKYNVQEYSIPIDPEELSDIAGSIYATVGNSYYCPSEQKYYINNDDRFGPYASIMFKLVTLQAYMTTSTFGPKETCIDDQRTTDLIPIIIGSSLAGLIIITLIVYLIYRSFLPEEVINLVNPESHYNSDDQAELAKIDNHSVADRF